MKVGVFLGKLNGSSTEMSQPQTWGVKLVGITGRLTDFTTKAKLHNFRMFFSFLPTALFAWANVESTLLESVHSTNFSANMQLCDVPYGLLYYPPSWEVPLYVSKVNDHLFPSRWNCNLSSQVWENWLQLVLLPSPSSLFLFIILWQRPSTSLVQIAGLSPSSLYH